MKLIAACVSVLFVAGCAPSVTGLRGPAHHGPPLPSVSPFPLLREAIDTLLADSLFPPSNAAVRVVSLRTGETLYDLNGRLALNPASNEKLFTSACALAVLGGGYEFSTRAYADTAGPARIIVRGSGDPLLSTRDVDSLAASIRAALPSRASWILAGDLSFFDDLAWGTGWAWDDEPDPSAMFISPLSLNGNAIRIMVRPGARPGDSARVDTDPRTSYVQVEDAAVTDTAGARSTIDISRNWREHLNTITVKGAIALNDTTEDASLSVADPHWYALTVLRERLEALGVHTSGLVLDTVPRGAVPLGGLSHRLDSVMTYMNHVSDNLSAENILKTLAAVTWHVPGSAQAGTEIVDRFLAQAGIDTANVVIADGSGVSRYNLTCAGTITSLLAWMHSRADLFPAWYASLAVAGRSGTIERRMRGTAAEGNLRAKTGTLFGVSALSGFVTTAEGEELAFSILMQNYPAREREYRRVQDRIGALLAGMKRRDFQMPAP